MAADLLVYVNRNHMEVFNLTNGSIATGVAPFTTHRLLVGEFSLASELLDRLVKEVKAGGLFAKPAKIIIQPLSMNEGGLSSVEERVLLELGASARAREVRIVVESKLTPDAAITLLSTDNS